MNTTGIDPQIQQPSHRQLQEEMRNRRRTVRRHSEEVLHKPGEILRFSKGAYRVMGDGSYRKVELPAGLTPPKS